jgi:hypothetical protein
VPHVRPARANVGTFVFQMPKNLKRHYGKGDLHFLTFSCFRRFALLGTARAKREEKLDVFTRDRKAVNMHRNAVTRRLVKDPKDWLWSSYASYSGRGTPLMEMDIIE